MSRHWTLGQLSSTTKSYRTWSRRALSSVRRGRYERAEAPPLADACGGSASRSRYRDRSFRRLAGEDAGGWRPAFGLRIFQAYPSSVTDKAARIGPTVRLANLREIGRQGSHLQGVFGSVTFIEQGTIGYRKITLLVANPEHEKVAGGQIGFGDKIFLTTTGEELSLNEIAQRLLPEAGFERREYDFSFETADKVTFLLNESIGPVRIAATAIVRVVVSRVDCDSYHYSHGDEANIWVLAATVRLPPQRALRNKTDVSARRRRSTRGAAA